MKKYRKIKIDNFRLRIHEKVEIEWLETLVLSLHVLPKVPYAPNRYRAYVQPLADNKVPRVFVKVYAHTDCQSRGFRRTNPFRRLLPRYAAKEGAAYLRFQRLGITVPEVLAFGEEWKFGVRNRGLFVVEAIEGPSLQRLLHETRDPIWINKIFKTIIEIHLSGSTHGDAHLVNFIESNDKICAIDIDKSKPNTDKGRITDLINIMTGIFLEVDALKDIEQGLHSYESAGLSLSKPKEELITIAKQKSLRVSDTDKARYYGSQPQIIHL